MISKIEETTREQVIKFLPNLIEMTLQSYNDFVSAGPEKDEDEKGVKRAKHKSFAEHHSAGKVALAHLDLMFKLAKSVDINTEKSEEKLMGILAMAKTDTNAFREKEVPDLGENDS